MAVVVPPMISVMAIARLMERPPEPRARMIIAMAPKAVPMARVAALGGFFRFWLHPRFFGGCVRRRRRWCRCGSRRWVDAAGRLRKCRMGDRTQQCDGRRCGKQSGHATPSVEPIRAPTSNAEPERSPFRSVAIAAPDGNRSRDRAAAVPDKRESVSAAGVTARRFHPSAAPPWRLALHSRRQRA